MLGKKFVIATAIVGRNCSIICDGDFRENTDDKEREIFSALERVFTSELKPEGGVSMDFVEVRDVNEQAFIQLARNLSKFATDRGIPVIWNVSDPTATRTLTTLAGTFAVADPPLPVARAGAA